MVKLPEHVPEDVLLDAPSSSDRRGPGPSATETQRAIGRFLRARAIKQGLTWRQISVRSGVSRRSVFMAYQGHGSWDTYERLARALRTTIEQALREDREAPGRGR